MIVENLAIIAVSISLLGALLSRSHVDHSTATKSFIISFIPLCVSLYLFVFPEALVVKGIGQSSGELLSFALKYSQPQQVSPTYEGELLYPGNLFYGLEFQWVLMVTSIALLLSTWKGLKWLSILLTLLLSGILLSYWANLPMSLINPYEGEQGVRAFIEMGLIEKKNLLSLIVPAEAWYYQLGARALLITSFMSALAILVLSLNPLQVLDFKWAKKLTAMMALCLIVLLVFVASIHITSSILIPLLLPTLLLSVAAVLSKENNHLLWLSSIAMMGLLL